MVDLAEEPTSRQWQFYIGARVAKPQIMKKKDLAP